MFVSKDHQNGFLLLNFGQQEITIENHIKNAHDAKITFLQIYKQNIISCSHDKTIKIWDLKNLNLLSQSKYWKKLDYLQIFNENIFVFDKFGDIWKSDVLKQQDTYPKSFEGKCVQANMETFTTVAQFTSKVNQNFLFTGDEYNRIKLYDFDNIDKIGNFPNDIYDIIISGEPSNVQEGGKSVFFISGWPSLNSTGFATDYHLYQIINYNN